jgi:Family of unknown function (DUF6788)
MPGTMTEQMTRCGHPGCRCHADPPGLHRPYHSGPAKSARKTVTRILCDDQLAGYSPGSTPSAALRALITEPETLSQEVADNDPLEPHRSRSAIGVRPGCAGVSTAATARGAESGSSNRPAGWHSM